jgi:AAA+ superfamily predicted ATPase
MTAMALAGELKLPLLYVQLHGLITKFMGETAAKLHLIFGAMVQTRGVYLFDEFDAIGGNRGAGNDVGEIRRVLNSFLQFLEQDDSDSLVIAATNFVGMLDAALFRRFDDVVEYGLPGRSEIKLLIQNRLAGFGRKRLSWAPILEVADGLSHAEISRACDDAAKESLLNGKQALSTKSLAAALTQRRMTQRLDP